jgi:hypothetical protein
MHGSQGLSLRNPPYATIASDVPSRRTDLSAVNDGLKDFFWTGHLPPLESGQNVGAHKSPEAHLFDRDLALSRT